MRLNYEGVIAYHGRDVPRTWTFTPESMATPEDWVRDEKYADYDKLFYNEVRWVLRDLAPGAGR